MKANMKLASLLLICLLVGFLPHTEAAVQIQTQFNSDQTYAIQQAGILGILSAGQTVVNVNYENTVARIGDTIQLGAIAIGPQISALPGIRMAQSFTGSGCTMSNIAEAATVFLSGTYVASSAQGFDYPSGGANGDLQLDWGNILTITAASCSGTWRLFACQATATCANGLVFLDVPISVHTLETQTQVMDYGCGSTGNTFTALTDAQNCNTPFTGQIQWDCGASGTTVTSFSTGSTVCLNPQIDNQNHLCPGGGFGSTCTNPTFNIGGSLSVTNSGTQHLVIDSWPTLTANVAATGSLTLSGTLNTVESGTVHILIDSWPSLTAAVTNSGTLNIQNPAGQTFALSGNIASSVTGSLTVTNAGGQSISVSSWPALQAAITSWPALTVHQDPICTAAAHCHIDSNTTVLGDVSTNVTNLGETDWGQLFMDWSPLIIGLVLVAIGEMRSDFITRGFGGVFIVMSTLISPIPTGPHVLPDLGLLQFSLAMFGCYMLLLMWFASMNAQLPEERKFRRN